MAPLGCEAVDSLVAVGPFRGSAPRGQRLVAVGELRGYAGGAALPGQLLATLLPVERSRPCQTVRVGPGVDSLARLAFDQEALC